jgi:hypothetical protein
MNHHKMKYLVGMLLLVAPLLVIAGGAGTRQYALPNHGKLQLQMPTGWHDQVKQPPKQMPPTITLTSNSGDSFKVIVTPMWPLQKDQKLLSVQEIKPLVEQSIKIVSKQAVEQSVQPIEIKNKQGGGYYFSVTDKAPQPGNYKHLSQGLIRIGDLITSFTILSNDGGEKDVKSALNMMRGARQIK